MAPDTRGGVCARHQSLSWPTPPAPGGSRAQRWQRLAWGREAGAGKLPFPPKVQLLWYRRPGAPGERLGAGPGLPRTQCPEWKSPWEPGARWTASVPPQKRTPWPGISSNGELAAFPSRAGLGTLQNSFLDASLHVPGGSPRPEPSMAGQGLGRSSPAALPGARVSSGSCIEASGGQSGE